MTTGRLHVFQRLARGWDAVHPYNAGQACLVAWRFESNTLDSAWNAALNTYGFQSTSPQCVEPIPDDLALHFTLELNRRFENFPFQAFKKEVEGNTWLVIVYQHWIADSVSIRMLLRDWLTRLAPSFPHAEERAHRPAPSRGGSLPLLDLFRRYSDYRRTRKVQTMGPLDYPTRVRLIDSPTPTVPALLAYARRRRVTLNDIFIAALATACDTLIPTEIRRGRRNLAISSIVDLRRSLSRDAGFGCLLGFNSTVCRPHELGNWDRLLRAIADRREGRSCTGVAWMHAAELASRFSPRNRMYDFYRKEAPFAGGISNVNLNETWFARQHPQRILDYVRISPTGPMVPVAMNVTTLGDRLRLSMTYRAALLNDWTAKELGEQFAERLMRIASETA